MLMIDDNFSLFPRPFQDDEDPQTWKVKCSDFCVSFDSVAQADQFAAELRRAIEEGVLEIFAQVRGEPHMIVVRTRVEEMERLRAGVLLGLHSGLFSRGHADSCAIAGSSLLDGCDCGFDAILAEIPKR